VGAERFRRDPPVSRAPEPGQAQDSRSCLVLVTRFWKRLELAEKLLHVLRPQQQKGVPEISEA
jgi:hypothetical protein